MLHESALGHGGVGTLVAAVGHVGGRLAGVVNTEVGLVVQAGGGLELAHLAVQDELLIVIFSAQLGRLIPADGVVVVLGSTLFMQLADGHVLHLANIRYIITPCFVEST